MLTLEKSHGLTKLGWREKSILLLMLKSDNPPGKPNPIWFDIYNEFGINYNALPKKYQPKFRDERNLRLSIHRLSKKGLVKPVSVVLEGSSLPDPRGYGYIFYSLTRIGRVVAEKLQGEEKASKIQEDLERAVKQLRRLKILQVTISQVRELLWQQSHDKFSNRNEFDRYWNNTKLGLMLKAFTYRRTQISNTDGRKKYLLMV
jgi:hypothetical protein